MKKTNENGISVSINVEETGLGETEIRRFRALVRKTNIEHPKPEDVQSLRDMLNRTANLWRVMGDLANLSIKFALTGNWLRSGMRISIESGIDNLKKDCGYKDAPAIEKLLIDQISVCWVQLQKVQIQYDSVQREGTALPEADYWERRVTAAHMRFLRACETLARVRKLSGPGAVQVNIGARQVNVAQVSNSADEDSGEQTKYINASPPTPSSKS